MSKRRRKVRCVTQVSTDEDLCELVNDESPFKSPGTQLSTSPLIDSSTPEHFKRKIISPYLPNAKKILFSSSPSSLSSPHISSLSSQSENGRLCNAHEVLATILDSPNRNVNIVKSDMLPSLHDSMKKKQKFQPKGLAEMFSKTQQRLEVEIVLQKCQAEASEKFILVTVIELKEENNRLICLCQVNESCCCPMELPTTICVVLQHTNIDIMRGSLLKILRPWKVLTLDKERVILMCVHYWCKIGQANDITKLIKVRTKTMMLEWHCPCKSGKMTIKDCPIEQQNYVNLPQASQREHHVDRKLESVLLSPAPPLMSFQQLLDKKSLMSGKRNCVVRVQRVHCRQDVTTVSWSCLCEDCCGSLSEIILQSDCTSSLHKLEGKIVSFQDLICQQRVNCRSGALLSLIETVWRRPSMSSHFIVSSQDYFSTSQSTAPSHLYCWSCAVAPSVMNIYYNVEYAKPTVTPLAAVRRTEQLRQTYAARIILILRTFIFVKDCSLGAGELRVLQMTPSFSLPPPLHNCWAALFKDVYIDHEGYHLDKYSTAHPCEPDGFVVTKRLAENLLKLTHEIPLLGAKGELKERELYFLEGRISAVEESECFSWFECQSCKGEYLSKIKENDFQCCDCNLVQSNLPLQIALVVYIASDLSRRVKLKVAQGKAKSLLPHSSQDVFDAADVVNREHQAIAIVEAVRKNVVILQEVILQS